MVIPLLLFFSVLPPAQADEDLLKTLNPAHPRLLVHEKTWGELKNRRKKEPVLDLILHKIESDATALLSEPPLTYKKEGKRLLAVSREAIRRVLDLAVASKVGADSDANARFRRRAEAEMLALASFSDWNPSHFLDVAEMTTAIALGYDWLYSDLSPATKSKLKNAIMNKGLQQGDDPSLPNTSWYYQEMNWNQVCLGGLALGALAIADEEPSEARKMLSQVRSNIFHGLKPYAPDGVDPEGPGYWGYGTMYQVLLNESLKTALGTDWNLGQAEGFPATAIYLVEVTGPTEKFFNYSDGGENISLEPALYDLAKDLQRPDLLYFQNRLLLQDLAKSAFHPDRFFPLIPLWSDHFDSSSLPHLPLNWRGDGPQPIAVFRSAWDEPHALFLAVKGGSASLNHAHMDAGSFVLDRDGVRWATDLGSQDYFSLESKNVDLWNKKQKSQRWDVFRIGPFSHNTLTIGNQLQQVSGEGKIFRFESDGPTPHVDLDLTSIFLGQATKVTRSFSIIHRRQVQILDSLSGIKSGETVRWNFTTKAEVTLQGPVALLKSAGQTLRLRIVEPANGKWKVRPADPPPHSYDAANPGVSLLSADFIVPPEQDLVVRVRLE